MLAQRLRKRIVSVASLIVACAAVGGCGREAGSPAPTAGAEQHGDPQPERNEAQTAGHPPASTSAATREDWDVYYIGDSRVGFARIEQRAVERPDGESLVRTEATLHLVVQRFGEQHRSELKMCDLRAASGELVGFESSADLGPSLAIARGHRDGDTMRVETTSAGQTTVSRLPWPADAGGYFAVEESLRATPLAPGQRRTVRALVPMLNQLAEIELVARQVESTRLLEGDRELLRIDSTTTLPGGSVIETTLWTDAAGETRKTLTSAMNQVAYRTTREQALAAGAGPLLDVGELGIVRLAPPVARPHESRRIRYRVRLDEGDPARTFPADLSQRVASIDGSTAEIEVRAIRPDDPPPGSTPRAPAPQAADREPNALVQSLDPRIVEMAGEAAGSATDPWATAVALERYVHEKVAAKNYSQTFASASDVARSLEGDCTEHAVLLAALARARGIPARAAIGLVYVPAAQGLGFHMWTEVYVRDRWIGVDGTLGRGGIGAAHLKLAVSSLHDFGGLGDLLPVAAVLGKLHVDVLEQE